MYFISMHLICQFDKIDCEDLSDDDDDDDETGDRMAKRKTVLVFLPGIHEIVRMMTILKDNWANV